MDAHHHVLPATVEQLQNFLLTQMEHQPHHGGDLHGAPRAASSTYPSSAQQQQQLVSSSGKVAIASGNWQQQPLAHHGATLVGLGDPRSAAPTQWTGLTLAADATTQHLQQHPHQPHMLLSAIAPRAPPQHPDLGPQHPHPQAHDPEGGPVVHTFAAAAGNTTALLEDIVQMEDTPMRGNVTHLAELLFSSPSPLTSRALMGPPGAATAAGTQHLLGLHAATTGHPATAHLLLSHQPQQHHHSMGHASPGGAPQAAGGSQVYSAGGAQRLVHLQARDSGGGGGSLATLVSASSGTLAAGGGSGGGGASGTMLSAWQQQQSQLQRQLMSTPAQQGQGGAAPLSSSSLPEGSFDTVRRPGPLRRPLMVLTVLAAPASHAPAPTTHTLCRW